MKNNHRKQYFAPICCATIFGLFPLICAIGLIVNGVLDGKWLYFLYAIIPVSIDIALVCVAVSRIKEIRGGQEDDLGKY